MAMWLSKSNEVFPSTAVFNKKSDIDRDLTFLKFIKGIESVMLAVMIMFFILIRPPFWSSELI